MERNQNGYIFFHVIDVTTGLPLTGDAGNLTAYVTIGGSGTNALSDTSAEEVDSTNAKGCYRFETTSGETDGVTLLFTCKSTTADTRIDPVLVFTNPPNHSMYQIDGAGNYTGSLNAPVSVNSIFGETLTIVATAAAATGTTITFPGAAGFSTVDNFYAGCRVRIVTGTGAGQERTIVSYVGSTLVATIDRAWITNPTGASGFSLISGNEVKLDSSLRTTDVNSAKLAFLPSVTAGAAGGLFISGANTATTVGGTAISVLAAGAQMDLVNAPNVTALLAIANKVEAEIIDETDSEKVLTAITDKIATVNPSLAGLTIAAIASGVRTNLTTELGRIDAAVSSRMATFTYTAPLDAAGTRAAMGLASANLDTQLTAIDDFLDTEIALILNRLGAFTGSGVNTVYGVLRAIVRSDLTAPSDIGGSFDPATDSTQAIRDRGDVAWLTGTSTGGTGNGDIVVDHDYGGTDSQRVVDSVGNPVDNAAIRAYVAADFAAGQVDPEPPTTYTGSDGRWVAPLMLDADDYVFLVYDPGTKRTKRFELTIA